MKRLLPAIIVILLFSCTRPVDQHIVTSPDERIDVHVFITSLAEPAYTVHFNDKLLIDTSRLGYTFRTLDPLRKDISITNVTRSSEETIWRPVWGTHKEIPSHYNAMSVLFRENFGEGRLFTVEFRVFDDGLGFRYIIHEHEELTGEVVVMDEHTEFMLAEDHDCWWIPADYDSYEFLYTNSKVSEIDASKHYEINNARIDRFIGNVHAVNTPVTMLTDEGLYLSIHEANLTDYADMTLGVEGHGFVSELVPWSDGSKVKTQLGFSSPWRTIQVAETPDALIHSHLLVNLNPPNRIENTDWIEPMKYSGIWWEMHINKSRWAKEPPTGFQSEGAAQQHGATTGNTKRYIDFNAENAIQGLLVEGWNTGWEYWGADTTAFFDFVTPYDDFDIGELVRYAKSRGVEIVGHHETSGDAANYDKRLEAAFSFYNQLGIRSVKTGYAGGITPKGEYHHGQWMVRHYRKVVETAARYGIMIDAHEPIKATGVRRTWPNMMTREGVRGMEYNAWSDGNPPSHTVIIPFTRMLGGPIDYTPGIFDIKFEKYKENEFVKTTLAKQLALLVVLYSPLQMAADLPENYAGHPAFQFIRDVAVDWDNSLVLHGSIGEFISIARKEKGTDDWFVGCITNAEGRTLTMPLDFLDQDKTYQAILYTDGPTAHWMNNPTEYTISEQSVESTDKLELELAPGGGAAIHLTPLD